MKPRYYINDRLRTPVGTVGRVVHLQRTDRGYVYTLLMDSGLRYTYHENELSN